jgi:hypothetical protein
MQLHLNRKIEVLLRLFMGCHVRFPWQLDNPIYSFQYFATPPIYQEQKQSHKRTC